MRRLVILAVLAVSLTTSTGCFLPIYSGDPNRRTEQLLYTSEDLRSLIETWERIWFLDMPDHQSPHRIHGGVI